MAPSSRLNPLLSSARANTNTNNPNPTPADPKQNHPSRSLHIATPSKSRLAFFGGGGARKERERQSSVEPMPDVSDSARTVTVTNSVSEAGGIKVRSGITQEARMRNGITGRPGSPTKQSYPLPRPSSRQQQQPSQQPPRPPSSIRHVQTSSTSSSSFSTTQNSESLKQLWLQTQPSSNEMKFDPTSPSLISSAMFGENVDHDHDQGDQGEIIMGMHDEQRGGGEDMDWDHLHGTLDMNGTGASKGKGQGVVVTIRVRPPTATSGSNVWSTPLTTSSTSTAQKISLLPTLPSSSSSSQQPFSTPSSSSTTTQGKEYFYDQVLPPQATNWETYKSAAKSSVLAGMMGFNSVVFAYGQTASGKTHTLAGTAEEPGVIPLSIDDIFHIIRTNPSREWLLRASYLELYNETLIDLLSTSSSSSSSSSSTGNTSNNTHHAPGSNNKDDIQILNGKNPGEIQLVGLTEMVVTTKEEVRKVLKIGEGRRRVGCTDWNERSSRSHSVFRIVIESKERSGVNDTPGGKRGTTNQATRISCLSLIDLAGSEKATANKERNVEGRHINQSLLTLKNVISKLTEQKGRAGAPGHIPYRDSKLTRLLQPSLSGDAKISVICTINPSASSIAESQSTLAFASGIKKVVLRAERKEVVDPAALIQQYQTEIADLKAKLAMRDIREGAEDDSRRRLTGPEREERTKFNTRLAELKRLILTSNNVEDDEDGSSRAQESQTRYTATPANIDHSKSTFSLQEELHIAQTKSREQAVEIERLRRELTLRPMDVNKRVEELEKEVEQLTLMTGEYEKNLLDPGQKVREDVEAEYLPKIRVLEQRLKEKEAFYRGVYEDVHGLKTENTRLKERCERLEAEKGTFVEIVKELELNAAMVGSPPREPGSYRSSLPRAEESASPTRDTASRKRSTSANATVPAPDQPRLTASISQPNASMGGNRLPSVNMTKLAQRMTMVNASGRNGMGLGSLREDSMFDLAKRAAFVEREDEDVF